MKQADPAKAAEVEKAYQDALAARFAYDSMWSPPVTYDLVGKNAQEARAAYDSFWVPPLEFDPNGSNAQLGWPSELASNKEAWDVSGSQHIYDHFEQVRVEDEEKYARWEDTAYDPTSEFTGIADSDTRIVTIDYPLEIFDVSGCDCGEAINLNTKRMDEPIPFDVEDCDIIELVP